MAHIVTIQSVCLAIKDPAKAISPDLQGELAVAFLTELRQAAWDISCALTLKYRHLDIDIEVY